jgi:dUTP pyrophosphatase
MANRAQYHSFQDKCKYTLYINPYTGVEGEAVTDDLMNYYYAIESTALCSEDSGIDLYVPFNQEFIPNKIGSINHQIRCFMKENVTGKTVGYYLYPRSSIYKYPLMMANSVGIIDAGYRGSIIAKVRAFIDEGNNNQENIKIQQGTKLFQICAPDLSPLNVNVIKSAETFMELGAASRGNNGFGSTGR